MGEFDASTCSDDFVESSFVCLQRKHTCQGELHSVREAWDFKSQENRDDEPCAQSLLLELHDIGDVAVGLVQLCIDSIQEIARCLLVILHLVHL